MASIRTRATSTGAMRYNVYYRRGGRGSKQESLTFTRKRDAEKARDLLNALGPDEALPRIYGKATLTGDAPTVAEWLSKHIDDLSGVSDRSRADYRSLAERYINPHLGTLDVDEVTSADISKWAVHLEKSPRIQAKRTTAKPNTSPISPKTLANLRGLLSAAFGYAVDEGLRQDNPMRRLRRSRAGEHEREQMCVLTPQEFGQLRALMPEHWRPFATFLIGTGLRFGEAVALEVRDVDLLAETPVVSVTKSWRRTDTGFEVGPPKSRKSRRTVSLSDDVVDVLLPLVTRPGDELLFTNPQGNRVLHANYWNRVWKPAIEQFTAATGKRPRVHDLRHTHASILISRGVHLEIIRDRLGHENIATTSGVYSHLMPDQHRRTAEALSGLLADERI